MSSKINFSFLIHNAIYVLVFLAIILTAILKYPTYEVNYRNSDATWHTLLTMQAYDETPISEHKFLPIVNLGNARDKWIPWGATIPDENGNYYYTSFSPMGYVLPYLFAKIFHLDATEFTLYIFNTLLLIISCFVIIRLLKEVFKSKLNLLTLAPIMVLYILSPEIMHGMGIVYWHQSLMQVFIPLQCLFYYQYIKSDNKNSFIAFLCMCLINPYTEWSGYVANAGFFLAEIIRCHKQNIKKCIGAFLIGITTIFSFLLFALHYLSTVRWEVFFNALKQRFFARNIATTNVSWTELFEGYWTSFSALIILVMIFAIVVLFLETKIKIGKNERLLIFVTLFPILENAVMKEHAISYSYDRMKLALPLMLILCWLISFIAEKKHLISCTLILITAVCFSLPYQSISGYIWHTDYRVGNEKLCDYLTENFDDSICGTNLAVRGYLNMSIGRGCYERVSNIGLLEQYASKQNCKYIVWLTSVDANGKDAWNVYKLNADIYDRETGNLISIKNTGSDIDVSKFKANRITSANLTDANWSAGIMNKDHSTILFENTPWLLFSINYNNEIICNGKTLKILEYKSDKEWIHVKVDQDASDCAYPMELSFK